jgi:peptidoglycan/LPS O-acetylase OafA/YrhL
MNDVSNPLKDPAGAVSGITPPSWAMVALMVAIGVVVTILLVSLFNDWRRRRLRRRERRMRHIWEKLPAPEKTRPLAWIVPAPEGEPQLAVLPKAGDGEKAA